MAKKQTRRSISVSRVTYERLKGYCEAQGVSMSQFVEARVGDYLGESKTEERTTLPRPSRPEPVPMVSVRPLAREQQPEVKAPRKITAEQIFTF